MEKEKYSKVKKRKSDKDSKKKIKIDEEGTTTICWVVSCWYFKNKTLLTLVMDLISFKDSCYPFTIGN